MNKLDVHIRLYDPAIDWTAGTGTPDTWPTTRNEAELVLKAGARPVRFHCTRLTRAMYSWAMEGGSLTERCARAFRAGVRRVDRADGPWTPAGVDRREYSAMTEDEAGTFGFVDQDEIGGLILEGSALPTDCGVGFSAQPSSLRVWAAMQRTLLSAAQSQAERRPTPSAPAQPPSESAPKSHGSGGSSSAARTAADAKGSGGRRAARPERP